MQAPTEDEVAFVKLAHTRVRDLAIEDGMLRLLLELERDRQAPATKELIGAGFEAVCNWRRPPELATVKGMSRHCWALLQGLELRRLVKHWTSAKIGRRVWELTDDGRFEARKLVRSHEK
jgi:hypothetical protein